MYEKEDGRENLMTRKDAGLPITWEEDGYTVTRTTSWTAPGCHEGCGVLVYVKDGKVCKVEGDRENPWNQGHLCPRCVATPDIMYHKDRILTPLKRDPSKRGDPDAWEEISYEEALDLWEKEFKRIAATYGPESLQAVCGTGRDIMWEAQRLLFAMDSPNVVSWSTGLACWMPRMVAYLLTMGVYCQADCAQCFEDRYDHPGYKIPEVIMVWGNNAVESSSDYFYGDWIVQCQKRGSKTIVIDPRLTWMAARADIWIQPRPAVDSAIAIAMLKTIIDEDLYDHEFVSNWCFGFDELKAEMDKYDVDELCEIAWIPADKLRAAARLYASGNNSAVQLGLAIDMQKNGVAAAMAIIDMMAICNNMDVPGGNIFTPNPGDVNFFGWGYDDLPDSQKEKMTGYKEYPIIRMGMRLDQPDLALIQGLTDEPYPFRGSFYMGCNPLCCMSNDGLQDVYKILNKMEYNVVLDYVMTPTAQDIGDLFIPITMYPEHESLRSHYTSINCIRTVEGIERPGDVHSDREIILDLGKRFREDMFPWDNVDDMLSALLEPSGFTYEEVRDMLWWYPEVEYKRYETGKLRADGKPGFPTPTGRIELYSCVADSVGVPAMPYYDEPFQGPISTPEVYEEYPIICMTGTRNIQFFHSEHRQNPKLREIQELPQVEINDKWCEENGIKEGDWVWIENYKGYRCRQTAKPTPTLRYGMANLNSGWWFPEIDPHDDSKYGSWDVNPNLIAEAGHQGPTGFGADVKALCCKIYKCEPEECVKFTTQATPRK